MSNEYGTIWLHRILRAPPERVYQAFIDPGALERWLPPYGFIGRIEGMDPRVGGGYRMAFVNFGTGDEHAFSVEYTELVPCRRIRHIDRFDDANLAGDMRVSVELRPVSCGTELHIVQEAISALIPEEICYLGWQESLEMLAQLVEPDIPS